MKCLKRYKESLSKLSVVVWFKNLKAYDWVRLAGIFCSCIATCLLMIAICTEYWVKRFVRGIFVFRGLWIDCQLGRCTFLNEVPLYAIFSIILMLISALACYAAVIYGTRSLAATQTSDKLSYSDKAITLSFFSGCLGGIGLFNFMRFSTDEPDTFLSWSMVPGWLSIVVASMAGALENSLAPSSLGQPLNIGALLPLVLLFIKQAAKIRLRNKGERREEAKRSQAENVVCHFVAKRWEEEETAEALTTTEVFTPWGEDPSKKKTQDSGGQKRK